MGLATAESAAHPAPDRCRVPRARVCASERSGPMSTSLVTARARAVPLNLFQSLSFSLLCFAIAHADDGSELQQVVVTATRIPTPILEVASSITVVTAADIEARQQRTFADVLKDIPGLNVVQTGGPGGETSVFMRGTNSNHTKVLIDGIDVS